MRKTRFKKRSLINLSFASIAFALVVSSTGCSPAKKLPPIEPNYLLTGTFSDTDDIFDFYDLGDDTYAVALNESNRTTYSGTIQIPDTHNTKPVVGIWHNAFHCSPATTVRIPSSITTIDFEAFLYSKVTAITIPYSVSEIGDAAFYCCSNLQTVFFVNSDQESSGSARDCYCDDEGESLGGGGNQIIYCDLEKIPSYCFFNCSNLTSVTFPASLEEICEEAFNGCSSLANPIYFQNIKTIRSRAFQGCTALRQVYISKSMFETANGVGIEPHAFNYCSYVEPNHADNLEITFCGVQSQVNTWLANHSNWGWRVDRENPATTGNSYGYTLLNDTSSYFSTDWDYTCDAQGNVTITSYNGPVPNADTGWFISVPDHMSAPQGNRVAYISVNAFKQATRQVLRRLYLPTTILAIDNKMFYNNYNDTYNNNTGFRDLYVVDDNTKCAIDKGLYDGGNEASIEGRIDLSGLTNLEFIGFRAFAGMGAGKPSGQNAVKACEKVQKLRLPSKIRAIGDEAFGLFPQSSSWPTSRFPNVDELTWEYDDANSRLETIGTDAFYGVGYAKSDSKNQIKGNVTWKIHEKSTIIFPRTFRHFATRDADKTRYNSDQGAEHPFSFGNDKAFKSDRPAHAFIGCSLISKVIFKGGAENQTTDLVVPLQTFCYNESLKMIVFEERVNHYITFHTQQDRVTSPDAPNTQGSWNYAQQSIGSNAGRGKNDFRSEPFLQTLVLPNKNTKLRFQSFCFQGNSRATIYLSDSYGHNMYSDAKSWRWTDLNFDNNNTDLSRAIQWRTIGDETYFTNKESQKDWGYCFGTNVNDNFMNNTSITTYEIDQKIPVYENVHFKQDIDYKGTPLDATDDITVEVGSGNAREFVEQDKFAFVCGQESGNYVATVANHLYDLHEGATEDGIKVPATVTAKISGTERTCTVNKIGDSAFSACYNDKTDGFSTNDDLKSIEIPDSIVSIGDYAFMRAYALAKISAYSGNNTARNFEMPTSLAHIGKNAFLFSGVQQVLKIPSTCRFYENYTAYPTGVVNDSEDSDATPSVKITSTFSNAVDLRKITFLSGGNEVASTDYYETTQYTSTLGGAPTYTCALYSKDHANLSYNKNRLLLVLNRDNADRAQQSANSVDTATQVDATNPTGLRFLGDYKSTPYMFGAFRMGYWIKELKCGKPTLSDPNDETSIIPQPLFSGIGTRGNISSTLTKKVVYLGESGYHYETLISSLYTIAGNVLKLPEQAMNGCENLRNVELPIQANGVIPAGVFANNTNANTKYYVENDTPVANKLDLTNSQYVEIGSEAFKNNTSIHEFIAPDVNSFTIDSYAFAGCTNLQKADFKEVNNSITIKSNAFLGCTSLTEIDFGSISGSVTINSSAFKSCSSLTTVKFGSVTGTVSIGESAFESSGSAFVLNFTNTGALSIGTKAFQSAKVTSITWPTSSSVSIGSQAFNDNDSLTTLTIPSNLSANLGGSCFAGCNYLTNVTIPGSLTGSRLGTSAFSGDNRLAHVTIDGATIGVTSIGNSTFSGCTALDDIEIEKFTAITSIGSSAFENTGTLTATGAVTLPTTLTSLGAGAFKGSKIVIIVIKSSTITLGAEAFANCSYLQAVRFTNSGCLWPQYNSGIFNNCTSLTELQLPTGFSLANSNDNYNPSNSTYFILNDTSIEFYTYHTYDSSVVTTNGWRKITSQTEKEEIHYYVTSVQDLIDGGVITNDPSVEDTTVLFWTLDTNDGSAINLGNVVSYSGGVVTFYNGSTLDGSGFHHA